jgi:hypothetical protein
MTTRQEIERQLAALSNERESIEEIKKQLERELRQATLSEIRAVFAPTQTLIKAQSYSLADLWLPRVYSPPPARLTRVLINPELSTKLAKHGIDCTPHLRAINHLIDTLWPVLERLPAHGTPGCSSFPSGYDLLSGFYHEIGDETDSSVGLDRETVYLAAADCKSWRGECHESKSPNFYLPNNPLDFMRTISIYGGNHVFRRETAGAPNTNRITWEIRLVVNVVNGTSSNTFEYEDPASSLSHFPKEPFRFD